jgi:hypothetical protein
MVIVDQNEADVQKTASLIEDAGGEAIAMRGDVSCEADCRAMVESAVSAYGRLNVAFNNAGVGASGFAVADEEEVTWNRLIDVNLKGVFLGMKYEIPAMLAAGGGAIVNTASAAGLVGERGIGIYTASKHGVVGLTTKPPRSTIWAKGSASMRSARVRRAPRCCPPGSKTRRSRALFSRAIRSGGSPSRKRSHPRFCSWPPTRPRTLLANRLPSMAA